MSPSPDETFGAALGALLDLAGVPRSGLMLAARRLPPADHLAEVSKFSAIPLPVLQAAREFAEEERVLYERACRSLAETRGVRALQFLHGVDRVQS